MATSPAAARSNGRFSHAVVGCSVTSSYGRSSGIQAFRHGAVPCRSSQNSPPPVWYRWRRPPSRPPPSSSPILQPGHARQLILFPSLLFLANSPVPPTFSLVLSLSLSLSYTLFLFLCLSLAFSMHAHSHYLSLMLSISLFLFSLPLSMSRSYFLSLYYTHSFSYIQYTLAPVYTGTHVKPLVLSFCRSPSLCSH